MGNCKIFRNNDGTINKVFDELGNESQLYYDTLFHVSTLVVKLPITPPIKSYLETGKIKDTSIPEVALGLWAYSYSDHFRNKYNITKSKLEEVSVDDIIRHIEEYYPKPVVQEITTIEQSVIKEGVEELFNSNLELANQVYEALGFEVPTTKLQGKKKNLQGDIVTFDVVEELASNERKDLPESILLKKLFQSNYIPKLKNGDILLGSQYRGGSFSLGSNYIEVKGANKDIVAKILNHELLHSVTTNIIRNYQVYVGEITTESIEKDVKYKKIDLTEKQINALNELVRLKNKVITYYKNNSDNIQDKYPDLGKSDYFIRNQYSEADLDEFISEVFSNKNLIEVLKQIPSEGKKSNLFKDFVDAIAKILGFTNTSILEDVIAYSEEAFFQQPQITPQQKQQALQLYSQYLDSIFPDSKVKDIVYHGTKGYSKITGEELPTFDKFDKLLIGKGQGLRSDDAAKGFYFGSYEIANKVGTRVLPAILDIQEENNTTVRRNTEDFDTKGDVFVVFEPEQIHILGNQKDIENFAKFVNNSSVGNVEVMQKYMNSKSLDYIMNKLIDSRKIEKKC